MGNHHQPISAIDYLPCPMSWHFPGWEGQDNGGPAANLEAAGQDCTENCSQGPRSVLAQEYGIELILCIPWYTMVRISIYYVICTQSVTINHICSLLNSVICISTMYSVLVVLNTAIYSCQGLLHTADRHDWRFRALFICPHSHSTTNSHSNMEITSAILPENLKLFIQPSELSPKVKRRNSNRAPIGHRINSHQPQPSGPQTHGRLSLDCSGSHTALILVSDWTKNQSMPPGELSLSRQFVHFRIRTSAAMTRLIIPT